MSVLELLKYRYFGRLLQCKCGWVNGKGVKAVLLCLEITGMSVLVNDIKIVILHN